MTVISYRVRSTVQSHATRLCELLSVPPVALELVEHRLPVDRRMSCVLGYYVAETRRAHVFADRCEDGDGDYSLLRTVSHEVGHHVAKVTRVTLSLSRLRNETPPTDYARTSPSEDFAESFMLWVHDPKRLAKTCPLRDSIFWTYPDFEAVRGIGEEA